MIKRNDSKSKHSSRKASERSKIERAKKRRLTLEGLESRRLMAVLTEPPIQPAPTDLPVYTSPRNIGTVPAASFFESEGFSDTGQNDFRSNADFIPLGNGPGQESTIDVTGTLPITNSTSATSGFSSDLDTFSFDLKAGDILDVATTGSAGQLTIRDFRGSVALTSSVPVGGLAYPLQTVANANATMVIPEDGRYYLTVGSIDVVNNYTVGLRTYRPTTESLAYGDAQILYLDFEGGVVDNNLFNNDLLVPGLPTFGFTVVPTFTDSLPFLGLEYGDSVTADRIITETYEDVIRVFEDLGNSGNNGDFSDTGVAGDYAIRILNSHIPSHRAWFENNTQDPRMTRLLIGGTGLDIGVPGVYGIAQSVDVGNFDLTEFGLFALDGFQGSLLGFPIAPAASEVDATIQFLSSVIAHEAGHTFGMLHTLNSNSIATISDAGGTLLANANNMGVGPDGIFGTLDDVKPIFRNDFYHPEVYSGFEKVTASMAHALSSGTKGGVGQTGRVFNDVNRNGADNSESGLAGVTVYADVNNNGVFDTSEPRAVTGADGSYSLTLPPGSVNIRAVTPTNFVATTASSVSSSTSGAIKFGFSQLTSNITGTVFVDNDGDGERDSGDTGLSGVYVYADLDGDNRPDLGEPSAQSAANGSYAINFPGPGTYTVRVVTPAGFEQTYPGLSEPTLGEHIVDFNGTSLTDNFNFGFLSSSDYGDAPDEYKTSVAAGGAAHGIIQGLTLGSNIDRELSGQPSELADGDDNNGNVDDEDGVQLTSPLGPGDSATFRVNVTNTTGVPAFLQAFMDFNRDGDFLDVGEQFVTNLPVNSSTGAQDLTVNVNVPADASVGTTYVRFRLSQQANLGSAGFTATGEVEDYAFPILNAAEIANDDSFSVPRNSLSQMLDVLGNDFQTVDNPLTIETLTKEDPNNTSVKTVGSVSISNDQKLLLYTPPNGFTGRDVFQYTVVDQFGNRSTATVVVNVTFQSNVPIAVDDSFEVAQDSSQRPLNVLNNDVPSLSGGISITSVTPGSAGGNVQIIGGGQSLRYTPQPGFDGTEEFTYSIQDSAGSVSSATVTVNLLPGTRNDDVVAFSIDILDSVDGREISSIPVGKEFKVRVSVEDLRAFANPEGVASAFLDLLYTDALVSTQDTDSSDDFPFDISFGPLFSRTDGLQRASAQTPGLIDEVGGVQQIGIGGQTEHNGPTELFTITMKALSPGVAQFLANPADDAESETVVLASDVALLVNQLRLGRTELLIVADTGNFTAALDDSFPDGRDSNGDLISASTVDRAVIDVLENDNLGSTGTVREFGLVTQPTLGSLVIDDNGTPDNLNDDFFSYRANVNANGLERFTYVIVTDDGIRSIAEATIALGDSQANAEVAIDFELVGVDGVTPISEVNVGDRFGIRVDVEDLRSLGSTYVFAGYLDVLYSQGVIRPANTITSDELNFDVDFGTGFEDDAAVGTASTPGIINEFGTLLSSNGVGVNPARLATLFFDAIAPGTAEVTGSPADLFPFQDTLLFNEDDPIDVSRIRYDKLVIDVGAGTRTAFQNPSLAQDVNNDGFVSPIDALVIINAMSRLSAEGEAGSGSAGVSYFTDVNGDERVTALDALQVINYLSRQKNQAALTSGEGEQVVPQVMASTPTYRSSRAISDEVFADFAEADLISDASSSENQIAQSSAVVSINDDADDETDPTDVIRLLADDVSGLWS
ncbi:Serine-aspartate repeat-containing protein D precursor [Rubripirellula lacrimiformis]|uniref:Serine-aspartate repeat-containing protein D n=1 Tax=Rubripirellula lacrimiformis TaxID=1930273 RepID=A0A517NKG4_9BACT|nr:Ig-like domain-containing protein [Rubripirellula lacrimiformis]QDT07631.1 Serine-aspartate repeat-containing protein D precursor [Rubripirellula lacrimiformis]